MRILFVTTEDPQSQGDYQEVSMLHGLRELLGDDCIDYPRKKIMYGDFSESPKKELHGWGFSLLTHAIEDVADRSLKDIDFVLYGVTDAYGVKNIPAIDSLAKYGVWYLDGHDHSRVTRTPCFKRELFKEAENVYPTGFGIPKHRIRPFIPSLKKSTFQKTAPPFSMFGPQILGLDARKLYCFHSEEDYYEDMSRSWFGLTCMKGGWDSLRHYEIIASGACLLFRDYDKKPPPCAPQNLPCFSYSSLDELKDLMSSLVVNNKPTYQYIEMVDAQRQWLFEHGTTEARAQQVITTLQQVKHDIHRSAAVEQL